MKKALVLVADGSEEIESVTIIDILRRAHIEVVVASVTNNLQVTCAQLTKLVAETLLQDIANPSMAFDVVALPGGLRGAQTFESDVRVQKVLKEFEGNGKLIAAMCASIIAIHAARIGEGKKVTSWPSFKEQLQGFYDYQEKPVATDINLITSRGPGTAMAWSLAVVEELLGKEKMQQVAEHLLLMY